MNIKLYFGILDKYLYELILSKFAFYGRNIILF